MAERTRADSPTKVCTTDGCERPLRANGVCAYHYRKGRPPTKNHAVECPTCGKVVMKRDANRRFCSLLCRDVWRVDQPDDPMYLRRISRLPAVIHPHRQGFEFPNQPRPLMPSRRRNGWARHADETGYGRLKIGGQSWSAHRLMAYAANGGRLDPSMHVHHTCAESLCIAPHHLQVVTPSENNAEMIERMFYRRRIAELEAALASLAPEHPLIAPRGISPAA